MLTLHPGDTLGGGDEAHEARIGHSPLLKHGKGVTGAAAGGEHGVCDDYEAFLDVFRELAVIDDGVVCDLVAVEADVADFGYGYQVQKAVHHAEAGAEDGYYGHLAAEHAAGRHGADGCFYLDICEGKVSGDLVSHEDGYFLEKLAEIL